MDIQSHTRRDVIFFVAVAAIFLFAIKIRLGVEIPDDAAFFLRYAENMAHGEFWVWNPGEKPIWGASAPFFALLLALPIRLGVEPTVALVAGSVALSVVSLAYTSTLLLRRLDWVAATAFVVFFALDSSAMFYAGNGLETPLTFALMTLALDCILNRRGDVAVGISAGLLMIHKLDLIPLGALLIIAHALQNQRLRIPVRSLVIAAIIALAWYLFAWIYFGAPVPNSFLTKALHQEDMPQIIGTGWFSKLVLWGTGHWIVTAFAAFGILRCGRQRASLTIFALGTLVTHVIAYTAKHPFEPYDWYSMPSLYTLFLLGSVGVAEIANAFSRWQRRPAAFPAAILVALMLLLTVGIQVKPQMARAQDYKLFLAYQERDRTDAGKWVAEHTPPSFRVLTMWGNPAYFSHRYVYDASFLNRKYESAPLLEKYHPEIVILENAPGTTPMTPYNYSPDYVPVKIFDRTFADLGNYFYTVYARKDVVGQISGVVFPVKTSCKSLVDCQRYLPPAPASAQVPTGFTMAQTESPGICSIDMLNNRGYVGVPTVSTRDTISLTGWAIDAKNVRLPDAVFIRLESSNGKSYFANAKLGLYRPDIPEGLKLPSTLADAGYEARTNLSSLTPGQYGISVIVQSGNQGFVCAAKQTIMVSQ
ncbi:glycosyltransferase family 87 protein [Paraburkholderia acidisoli]|uniref:Glycosyltransferase RgtA/B/C/D-like domain-containing protein n=1 Tax=Paraburkholderia acidisoli TaxID=2571748 RepID=A0A7Z2JD60_9BURK|nr:hypothetical protein [Paraburkholderia acidisoli]QGZ60817.1 hypothetical protein FAZ98_03180 [Paraburkholderia acidisoli]